MSLLHKAYSILRRNEPKGNDKKQMERDDSPVTWRKLDGVDLALFVTADNDYIVIYYHHSGDDVRAVGKGYSVSKALENCKKKLEP